ncbi:MAG: fluoride efflux transporter CrcB [Bacteroidetes bacterium QS_8_68_15]|nr:MAG: fluoride efflux transporter CrcB [Bacteroidetes bacterium QS_8_68_15]
MGAVGYQLLLIAAGGALGALMRHAVAAAAQAAWGEALPYGTLAANLAGCFLIGLLWTVSEEASFAAGTRALVFTGVLGAFTTFSTYGLEAVTLLREGKVALALTYLLVSNGLGLGMVYLGLTAARRALGSPAT